MTAPYLVASLAQLRDQFNHEFPARAKGADGWIADSVHSSTSDHQPDSKGRVRAIDITTDLKRPGVDLWSVCEMLRQRQASGADNRLEYIIHMRKIASRTHGWVWRTYTGTADPHTNHAHFSARHDGTGYNDTRPWGLEDIMVKSEFMAWLNEGLTAWAKGPGRDALNGLALTDKIDDAANPNRTVGDVLRDVAKLRGVLVGDAKDTANAKLAAGSPLAQLLAVPGDVEEIAAKLAAAPTA